MEHAFHRALGSVDFDGVGRPVLDTHVGGREVRRCEDEAQIEFRHEIEEGDGLLAIFEAFEHGAHRAEGVLAKEAGAEASDIGALAVFFVFVADIGEHGFAIFEHGAIENAGDLGDGCIAEVNAAFGSDGGYASPVVLCLVADAAILEELCADQVDGHDFPFSI